MLPRLSFALLAIALGSGTPTQAQTAAASVPNDSARTLRATRLTGALRIDGRLDEAVWRTAEAADAFTESYPTPGAPARQRTDARVVYDADAIYVGIRLLDSAPDSIAAQLARRDASGIYSDWVHLLVDSFHDRRTAFRFSVNPRGVKRDVYTFDDGNEDAGWDTVWEVATSVDSLGWVAEYRIPLSQLRFSGSEPAAGRSWGLQIMRDVARYEARYSWSPWKRGDAGFVSRFGTLEGLAGLRMPQRLELRPYTVAQVTRRPGEGANPFHRSNDAHASVGGDLQYGIGSNLTLTATFNPDFGQVEADPSQVNLSANETVFAERRPFFLEGADIFRFGIGFGDGNGEELFYSRRVGRVPQRRVSLPGGGYQDAPEATTILGAAKLTGRTPGGWGVGILNAVTAEEQTRYVLPTSPEIRSTATEPLTNYTVARVRRDFRRGSSAIGGIVSAVHRSLSDQALNFLPEASYAGGFDVRHRFNQNRWEAAAWVLGSYVRGDTVAIARRQTSPLRYFQRPDAEHVEYDPTRTSLGGVSARAAVSKISGNWRAGVNGLARSPEFEVNDLGFQRDADQLAFSSYVGHIRFTPSRWFRSWALFGNFDAGTNWGGQRIFTGGNVNGNFQLKNLWSGWGGVYRNVGGLSAGTLRGGPAILRPGSVSAWGGMNSDRRKPVSFSFGGNAYREDESGSQSWNLGPSIDWRPSGRADLSLRPSLSRNRDAWQYVGARADAGAGGVRRYLFAQLDQTTVSLTARLNYTFTPNLSLQFYAQPFVSAGSYDGFKEVADPRAARFRERLRTLGASEVRVCGGTVGVRPSRDGCGSAAGVAYQVGNPDFNVKQFRSNAVLRWEYRPGSTFFVVWSQGRQGYAPDGSFDTGRDFRRLFDSAFAPSTNVLLLKASYWLGR